MATLFPNIKWAQLNDIVHVTLSVPDVKDPKITIENDKVIKKNIYHKKKIN